MTFAAALLSAFKSLTVDVLLTGLWNQNLTKCWLDESTIAFMERVCNVSDEKSFT